LSHHNYHKINVPRLAKGKGYKGPGFRGCCNTGMDPAIFHSRNGRWVVGPEERCRDAMRAGATLEPKRTYGEGTRRVWLYKSRGPAVTKFMELCSIRERENAAVCRRISELAARAARGDVKAALALADY